MANLPACTSNQASQDESVLQLVREMEAGRLGTLAFNLSAVGYNSRSSLRS